MTREQYREFARDMLLLCEKHKVHLRAGEGFAFLGPDDGKVSDDYPYRKFEFSPGVAELGERLDSGHLLLVRKS